MIGDGWVCGASDVEVRDLGVLYRWRPCEVCGRTQSSRIIVAIERRGVERVLCRDAVRCRRRRFDRDQALATLTMLDQRLPPELRSGVRP